MTNEKTITEQLTAVAKEQPHKAALIVHNKPTTYLQLQRAMCGFANFLTEKGIKKGDFLMVRASTTATYWTVYLGAQLAGATVVPLEKDCTEDTILSVADSLGKVFALVSKEKDLAVAQKINALFVDVSSVDKIAEDNYKEGVEYVYPSNDDIGQILFTTGTTGKAKGVALSNRYFTDMAHVSTEHPYGQNGKESVITLPVPMNHVLGVGRSIVSMYNGGTAVLIEGLFDLTEFFDALKIHKANSLALTPSALNYIVAFTADELVKYTSQIQCIEIGGEKMPPVQQQKMVELLPGVRMFNMYASTEVGITCFYEFSKHGIADNRIGTPFSDVTIHFMDEEWKDVPATKENPAYIVIESNRQMQYYWGDKVSTDKIKRGNMIMMSDYGYVDEEGFICLAGRAGDVIISGGHKINPTDVENAAMNSGLFSECVCVGRPHEVFGKIVVLYVVVKDGVEFNKFEIKEYLAHHLESFKQPKVIEKIDKVARNKNGKIDRKHYV